MQLTVALCPACSDNPSLAQPEVHGWDTYLRSLHQASLPKASLHSSLLYSSLAWNSSAARCRKGRLGAIAPSNPDGQPSSLQHVEVYERSPLHGRFARREDNKWTSLSELCRDLSRVRLYRRSCGRQCRWRALPSLLATRKAHSSTHDRACR